MIIATVSLLPKFLWQVVYMCVCPGMREGEREHVGSLSLTETTFALTHHCSKGREGLLPSQRQAHTLSPTPVVLSPGPCKHRSAQRPLQRGSVGHGSTKVWTWRKQPLSPAWMWKL